MKEKQVKLPGPDQGPHHPISIQRNPARVVVSVAHQNDRDRLTVDVSDLLSAR
jgi:hypothetical protein